MKVCLINNLYPPFSRGGAEQVVEKTVAGLLLHNYEVVVVTTSQEGDSVEKRDNLTIYRFRPLNIFFYTEAHKHVFLSRLVWHVADIFNLSSARRIRNILQTEKPGIVHTHNLMGIGFLIPRLVKKLQIKHVHTVHDVQLVEPSGIILKNKDASWRYNNIFSKFYSAVLRNLMGSPNIIISPSKFLLDFYKQRGFFKNSTMVMLRNPAPEAVSLPVKQAGEKLNLLYLGQVEEHKGTMFLVRALKQYLLNGKLTLHVVGSGSLLAEIKKEVKDCQNVKIYGKMQHDKLPQIFQNIDVTVVPSLCYENSPTVIFESFSFGVPVLASRVEGVEELIQEGENGLTFATGNAASLIEKIQWCENNMEKLQAIGVSAQKLLTGLSEKDYIDRLISLY